MAYDEMLANRVKNFFEKKAVGRGEENVWWVVFHGQRQLALRGFHLPLRISTLANHGFPVALGTGRHSRFVLIPRDDGVDHLPLIKIIEEQQQFSLTFTNTAFTQTILILDSI